MPTLCGTEYPAGRYSYPAVLFEGEWVPEAYLHDTRVLPHQVQGGLEQLFPRAIPCEELQETLQPEDWLEHKGLEALEATRASQSLTATTTTGTESLRLFSTAPVGGATARRSRTEEERRGETAGAGYSSSDRARDLWAQAI